MEFKARKMDLRVLLLPLLIIGVSLSACDSDEILDPAEASGTVLIEPQPSGLEAPWSLVTPMGDIIEGDGAASLKSMVIGDYVLSWGAVEGYRAPDVARRSLAKDATITFSGSYEPLAYGTVVVDVEPDAADAGWMLVSEDGELYEGNGDSTLTKITAGEYSLAWIAAPGYDMPAENPVTFTLAADATETVQGTYTATARGSIAVDVSPDSVDAPWSLGNSSGELVPGTGDQTVSDLPLDTYTLTWGYVDGWDPPDPRQVEIVLDTDGQSETVSGTYTESDVTTPTGTVELVVSPSGLAAPWSLSGPDGFSETGTGSEALAGVPVGDYEVEWGAVSGYSAPASQRGTLVEGGTLTLSGDYVSQLGRIEIRPEPSTESNLPWTLSGPGGFVRNGFGASDLDDVLAGEYTITWGDAPGRVTPAPETAVLNAGETLIFTATFAIATGWITVDPSPDSIDAPWTLTPESGSPSSGNGDVTLEVDVGTYTLTWGDVDGWLLPDPSSETVEVAAGETVVVSGQYTEDTGGGGSSPATGTVEIDVTPDEASWSLSGPDGFSESGTGDASYADVSTGTYEVTWSGLSGYSTPSPSVVDGELDADASLTFTGVYTEVSSEAPRSTDGPTTIRDGQSVTIQGVNFGTKVPAAPIRFLDFDDGIVGERLPDQSEGGLLTSKNGETTHYPQYSNDRGRYPGDLSVRQWYRSENGEYAYNQKMALTGMDFDTLYVSAWVYRDDYAGTAGQTRNAKLDYNLNSGNLEYPQNRTDANRTQNRLYFDTIRGADLSEEEVLERDYHVPAKFTFDQWFRLERKFVASDPMEYNGMSQVLHSKYEVVGLHNVVNRTRSDQHYRELLMSHYLDPTDDVHSPLRIYHSDIYIDNTFARVEIGDAPTYDSCTRWEMQLPTAWENGQLTFSVNQGQFERGDTVYVYVFNSDDVVSNGFAVTVE